MSKYALITGGTKGIGFSVARHFAQNGYNLLLTYASDTDRANMVKRELQEFHHAQIDIIQADISENVSIEKLSCFVEDNDIALDVIIFNAGITYRCAFEELEPSLWEKSFFANIHFPTFLIQKNINHIKNGGSIIFTGSLTAIYPHATSLAYGVTKEAVHSLVKNLVKFLAPYKIRVNAVAPGFVDTDWQKEKPEEIRKNIEQKIALNRFCSPDELVDVYKLLADNSYVNGEIIVIDGGYSYK